MIHPQPCTILDLLNQPYNFVIPTYQRGYDWQKEEIGELVDDLLTSESPLYLGTMIFDDAEKDKTNSVSVVDGQQRLTTLLLMLIACREAALKLGESQIAAQTQSRIAFIDAATGETKGSRLLTSLSIRDLFDYIAAQPWDRKFPIKLAKKHTKLQVRYLKPAYDYIEESLAIKSRSDLSRVLTAIYKINVIRIDVDQEEEAFSIFERTNARGVDLEVEDLLKNYLYQKGVSDLGEKWATIIGNSDRTVLRMLKYFYMAHNGPVAKADLYKRLKAYAVTLDNTEVLVDQLKSFSDFYATVRREQQPQVVCAFFHEIGFTSLSADQDKYERVFNVFQGLRLFRITQAVPLIYSALLCALRLDDVTKPQTGKQLISLIQNLERYHFINNAIGERPTNEVERIYAKFCLEFKTSKSFSKTSTELLDELAKTLISDKVFTEKFCQLSYSQATLPLIAYVFDRICNVGKAPGQRLQIYNPDPRVLRKAHNIEHFAPQKPEDSKKPVDAVDNIGNLLAISFQVNSSLGNLSPQKKIQKLKGDLAGKIANATYVNTFISSYEQKAANWSDSAIEARAADLAKYCYKEVWRFPA